MIECWQSVVRRQWRVMTMQNPIELEEPIHCPKRQWIAS